MADVGLVGFPNAGKSTLFAALTSAKPKIADYEFTTLKPNLGIVEYRDFRSFVMADIPGLIEGAAEGAGLGIRFLRHIQRTRLLLHLVDIAPIETDTTPGDIFRAIESELLKFSEELLQKPRWLVINKIDLLPEPDRNAAQQALVEELCWEGPVFQVSAETGQGTDVLGQAVMRWFEEQYAEVTTETL